MAVGPASAWPAPKGETLAITSYTYYSADQRLGDRTGPRMPIHFEKHEASLFVEHGLTDRVTLVAKPSVQRIRSEQALPDGGVDRVDAFGLGGSEVGARMLLGRPAGAAVTLQLTALSPNTIENAAGDPVGDGGYGAEIRLLLGESWGWRRRGGFASAQLAYRARTEVDSPEARVDLTLGLRPSRDWMLLGQSFSRWSTERVSGFAQPDAQYYHQHQVQFSALRHLDEDWALQLGAFASVAGRNVLDEEGGVIALWRKY